MKLTSEVQKRMLKMAVVLSCLLGFIIQTVQFLFLYWTYPTVMDIQEYLPMEFDLPGISFCNSNGLIPEAFCFTGKCFPEFIIPYLKICRVFPTLCLYTDHSPKDMKVIAYHSIMKEYNVTVSLLDAFRVPVNEFLKCKIVRGNEEFNCSMDDVMIGSYYSDSEFFNMCYTINTFWGNAGKKIEKIKKYDKIILDFFVDLSGRGRTTSLDLLRSPKATLLSTNVAIQLAVHSPLVSVNPYMSGLSFLGGKKYQIKLKMEDKHLLPPPYQTNCTDYMASWISRGGTGPLNQMMVVEECKFNKSLEIMGCVPFLVDYPHNETICKYCTDCPEISAIAHECSELLHFYNQPCDFSTYEMDVLEKPVFVEKVLENRKTGENEYNCSFEQVFIQRCQEVLIEISFDDFSITNLTYNAKIESLELFSIVGGYMGIYLGVSLVTGFDVADFLFNVLFVFMQKKQKNSSKRRKNQVSDENMPGQNAADDDSLRRRPKTTEERHTADSIHQTESE